MGLISRVSSRTYRCVFMIMAETENRKGAKHPMIMNHEYWIGKAFESASAALASCEVPVGCILVHEPSLTSFSGGNETNCKKNATRHAELVCFDKAANVARESNIAEKEYFSKCVLYVTVEPCIMCAAAIALVGLSHVYFCCRNERFGGCGSVENVIDQVPFTEDSCGLGKKSGEVIERVLRYGESERAGREE